MQDRSEANLDPLDLRQDGPVGEIGSRLRDLISTTADCQRWHVVVVPETRLGAWLTGHLSLCRNVLLILLKK